MSLGPTGRDEEQGARPGRWCELGFGIPCSQMLLWAWAIPVQSREPLGASSVHILQHKDVPGTSCPCVTCQVLSPFKANKCFLCTPWILQGLAHGSMCI